MTKLSNFAIKFKDKCVLRFRKKDLKMVEKGIFTNLENKTHTINLFLLVAFVGFTTFSSY
jgi:hypothetical protein